MSPEYELYLLSVRALSIIDELELKDNMRKSYRTLERVTTDIGKNIEMISSDAHERSVHNFNVILNSIDDEILKVPIGGLTIKK